MSAHEIFVFVISWPTGDTELVFDNLKGSDKNGVFLTKDL